MNTIPISPLISPQGNLVSLELLRGNLLAAPVQLDSGTALGNVSVATQQISVSAAGKLGLGSIFGVSADRERDWILDGRDGVRRLFVSA